MSRVEVDKIQQQCGTTLTVGGGACKTAVVDATTVTLGRCGGTVSLASGATQSGFGRTGTVDWITTPKVTGDSPITGVTGKGYFLNTTAGEITLNLPAGSAGDIISMADYAATWQTYKVTVAPNGSEKIGGENENATLNTEGQSVTFVYVDSTQGWVNTMDSTSNVRGGSFLTATVSGACNTLATAPDCANVKVATFLGPGTFCVSAISGTAADNTVGYMVVAGGGSGGTCCGAGGGGAGGYREGRNVPIDNFTASPLVANAPTNAVTVTATPYPITVGGGAAAVGPSPARVMGNKGSDSIFSSITATGGGGGYGGPDLAPATGGSGGGASHGVCSSGVGSGNTPSTTPPQGNDGGAFTSPSPSTTDDGGGGGGGAGGVGVGGPCASPVIGQGGPGVPSAITGVAVVRGGGGSAGMRNSPGTQPNVPVPGAPGGGGYGGGSSGYPRPLADASAGAGTSNTGGGGGGAARLAPNPGGSVGTSGQGGSGIVVIRYKFQ
jgi:hypothetical protein